MRPEGSVVIQKHDMSSRWKIQEVSLRIYYRGFVECVQIQMVRYCLSCIID